MRVNLLGEKRNPYSIDWFKIILLIAGILLVVTIGSHYYILLNRYSMVKTEVVKYNNQTNLLSQKKLEYFTLQSKIEELENYKKKTEKFEYYWDDIIREIGYVIPEKLMLKSIQIEDKLVKLSGMSEDNQQVLEFINNLKKSEHFTETNLKKMGKTNKTVFEIETFIDTQR